MRRILGIALLATLSLLTQNVSSYGTGADPSVCDSMIPGHGAPPQSSESPYKITLGKASVKGYETVDITLTPKNGQDIFKGFLIQVRKPGGSTPEGKFTNAPNEPNTQVLKCSGIEDSAMTHIDPSEKKSVTVTWTAPNEDGEYQVYYTAVGSDSGTFWSAITHNENIRVTKDAQATTPPTEVPSFGPETLKKLKDAYDGCGNNKGCFGMPKSCVEGFDPSSSNPKICDILLTWAKNGDKNDFQLIGRTSGSSGYYLAVGMSDDDKMGKDSVVGCAFSGSDQPRARRYFNPDYSNQIHSNMSHGLIPLSGSVEDGVMSCKFQQTNHEAGGMNVDFDKEHYFLLSRKSTSQAQGPLPKHDPDSKIASPQAVHISDNIILDASVKTWLLQLHGGLMLIAWLLCASTGMFTARYYKQTHTDFMPLGKAFWFGLHTFCMSSTVFLTICGSIFILIFKKGLYLQAAHPILGVIVVGLALLQVVIALFRPHPGTPKRPLFNWFHWGVGTSAHIVAIACIFMAWDLDLANLKRFSDQYLWQWIMMALVLFHFLMHVVMSIHTLWADKEMEISKNKKRGVYPGPMKPNGLSSEAPGTSFRTFMLALYLLVMGAGAIALICLVFWPIEKKEDVTE